MRNKAAIYMERNTKQFINLTKAVHPNTYSTLRDKPKLPRPVLQVCDALKQKGNDETVV